MKLTAGQRLHLLNILPNQGSLREAITIKRLRDQIQFNEDEQDVLDFDPQTGDFDPTKLSELTDSDLDFTESEREVIASAIVMKDQEESVPTDDSFVDLALKFQDEIQSVREDVE